MFVCGVTEQDLSCIIALSRAIVMQPQQANGEELHVLTGVILFGKLPSKSLEELPVCVRYFPMTGL